MTIASRGPVDETRHAQAEAHRRGGPEQERGQQTDARARAQGDGRRAPSASGRRQHETVDARVEVAERLQALAQVVHAVLVG